MRLNRKTIVLLILAALILIGLLLVPKDDIPNAGLVDTEWSIGAYTLTLGASDDPRVALVPHPGNPILTADSLPLTDAHYVADPFLIRSGDLLYLFFEVLRSANADIGLATSKDGISWHYEGIVLDEPFHLSYPLVFSVEDKFYMLPESAGAGSVRLYEAADFPFAWTHVHTLITGDALADPTLFHHQGRWWLFVIQGYNQLLLYSSPRLAGPWTEHPASPVVDGNAEIARPGGGVLSLNDRLFRVAQDDWPSYGEAVRIFEITKLNELEYEDRELDSSPWLAGSGGGWNADGMHHLSAVKAQDGTWLAAVDGRRTLGRPYIFLGNTRVPVPSGLLPVLRYARSLL